MATKLRVQQLQNPYKCRAHASSTQSIASATWTTILMQTKDYDPNTNFNVATGLYTAPVSGYYQINGSVRLITVNTQPIDFLCSLIIAGVTDGSRGTRMAWAANSVGISANLDVNVSDVVYLAAGDTVGVAAYHNNSGSNRSTEAGSYLSVHLLSI